MSSAGGRNIQTFEDELRNSIEEGDIERLQRILQDNAINSNQKMRNGDSLLHFATKFGQTEIVEFLLEQDASTTTCDSNGNIALHLAIKGKRLTIGEFLLQNQAAEQLHKQNEAGQTPLDLIQANHAKNQWLLLIDRYVNRSSVDEVAITHQQSITSEESNAAFNNSLTTKLDDGYSITEKIKGTHLGKLYQLNTLALLSLRGSEDLRQFRLATEVAEFNKFDDAVFDCGGLYVMQIKYRSTGKHIDKFSIFNRNVFERESDEAGFSVQKYLDSYWHLLEIESTESSARIGEKKKDFDLGMYFRSYCRFKEDTRSVLKEAIILTNTTFAQGNDLDRYFEEDPLRVDHILFIKGHLVQRYKIRENSVSNYPITREFIEKFRFVLNYPDLERIENLIRDRISVTFKKKSSELIANSFFNEIQNWFKTLASKAIDNKMISDIYEKIHDKLEIIEVLGASQANFEHLQLSNINFIQDFNAVESFLGTKIKKP